VAEATALARAHGLAAYLDGARVWNAAVGMGVSVQAVCAPFDTVSLCLSKGLGAPIGSVLAGSAELIARARRIRKMLGGGLHQAGGLAAAGLYALEHNVERLAEDHDNAANLARGLGQIEDIRVESLATNMLFVTVPAAHCAGLKRALLDRGVLAAIGPRTRLVLHLDVPAEGVTRTIEAFKAYFSG